MSDQTLNKATIMIVEDEGVVALSLERSLENLGYSVCAVVSSGEDAIKKVEEKEPDLVLMDIMLAGEMDGIEVATELHSRFRTPVIYLTAYADKINLERAKLTEPFGYIIKPFEERELQSNIEMALYKHKMETKLLKAKEEAEKARDKAEEATELKDKFVSLVAHDLRAPLANTIVLLKLILTDQTHPLCAEHQEILDRVTVQDKGLLDMIQELLDISRFKTGKIKPNLRFMDAHFVGLSAVTNFKYEAEKKGIQLVCQIPDQTRIFVDNDLFNQVIKNLVSNAVKFCKSGDCISLFIPPGEPSTIAVKDTGVGIEEKRHPALFKYEEKTTTRGTGGERGTGLGLPLSRDIMEAHGGKLEFESTPGKGSVFYARLPLVQPVVLVADADDEIRLMIRKFLEKVGVKIIEAENGKEALEAIGKSTVHLVIAHLRMPVMDGFELMENIRNNLSLEDLPIIILTSDKEEKTRERVFRFGANDFVNKPIESIEFVARVRRFIV